MVSECQAISRRKLKPLVITMGSQRQEYIEQMFANETMRQYFESPVFSQGIPSRSIRSQMALLRHAGKAGILPDDECSGRQYDLREQRHCWKKTVQHSWRNAWKRYLWNLVDVELHKTLNFILRENYGRKESL